MSVPAKDPLIRRISPSVLLSLSHSFALYLALPLCIIFTSLAFQKSYLYESCVAGALVSLSLLGYETGATQPARLSSGLSEDAAHSTNSQNKLSLTGVQAKGYSRMYVRTSQIRGEIYQPLEINCVISAGDVNRKPK